MIIIIFFCNLMEDHGESGGKKPLCQITYEARKSNKVYFGLQLISRVLAQQSFKTSKQMLEMPGTEQGMFASKLSYDSTPNIMNLKKRDMILKQDYLEHTLVS